MLTGKCIHPELMRVLSLCGHGDKVLIADGNYPLASKTGEAEKVYLGLIPGLPTVTDVLSALQSVCGFEKPRCKIPLLEKLARSMWKRRRQDVRRDLFGAYPAKRISCELWTESIPALGPQLYFALVQRMGRETPSHHGQTQKCIFCSAPP